MTDLRQLERDSIRRFLEENRHEFRGRVLDYGCGHQPYRAIVESIGAEYTPFDRSEFPASVVEQDVGHDPWRQPPEQRIYGTILCTQVLQYVPAPRELLNAFGLIAPTLILTYPTNWPEVETEDLWRWTREGMEFLLDQSGWRTQLHEERARIVASTVGQEQLALGYGVIATR